MSNIQRGYKNCEPCVVTIIKGLRVINSKVISHKLDWYVEEINFLQDSSDRFSVRDSSQTRVQKTPINIYTK